MRILRSILSFAGYWLAATFALHSGLLWVLEPLFTKRWHVLAISAGIAFAAVAYVAITERDHD
jgi:hypothetical protein